MSEQNTNQLSLRVLKKFRIIYGSLRQHFREVERTCGVTGSQLWIMQEIAGTSGIGVSDLAMRLSIHQSTCSQLVEKLVTNNLIIKKRSKDDQRRVGLWLSEEAIDMIKRAPNPTEGVLPKALRNLPIETIQTLDSAMEQVIEQLQIADERFAEKPLSDL